MLYDSVKWPMILLSKIKNKKRILLQKTLFEDYNTETYEHPFLKPHYKSYLNSFSNVQDFKSWWFL